MLGGVGGELAATLFLLPSNAANIPRIQVMVETQISKQYHNMRFFREVEQGRRSRCSEVVGHRVCSAILWAHTRKSNSRQNNCDASPKLSFTEIFEDRYAEAAQDVMKISRTIFSLLNKGLKNFPFKKQSY